ncbi:glycosyl hydrolase [candidate division KSB3 bacterium]|uniref:Glycosyl hydrolase n=1 Tax=candidate division KSB3 bacterium TaxID=2044937 RepID=A0A2G6KGA9_9BACT|nr:MAG: glycosyl hydrolase [candidate division KSB3 bacterium]
MTSQPIYKDSSLPIEKRVADLISRMTLEEKASQMLHEAKAVERLGIPEYNWWNECLHGVARAGRATVFPQAIGMAASFDVDLLFRVASVISDEARAKYHAAVAVGNRGQYKGLTFWTPNVNIFRDPRWGRGQETYGEDPFLTGELGVAFVKGLQGDHPKYMKTAACAKHFAVHSGPEADRHHFDAVVSQKDLHETYLPAFKALIDADVEGVMGAYNRTLGEPCCGSQLLLVDILREAWNFKGYVVSDCWAVRDFHEHHNVTSSPEESVALAVNKGCDVNCGCTYEFLVKAVEEGLLDESTVDKSLTRLFTTRFKLGMFDPQDDVPYSKIPLDVVNCESHRTLAREAAVKSMVLLKNENNLLPIEPGNKKLLLIGPDSSSISALLGNYYGVSDTLVTVLEGIVGKLDEGISIEYRTGCQLKDQSPDEKNWAFHEAESADIVIAVFGLDPSLEGEEGDAIASDETGDRSDICLPRGQEEFLKQIKACGTPVVLVLAGGSPIAFPEDIADAILFMWYPGEEGGNAVADVLFGDVSPSGKLPLTFPKSIEQLLPYDDYSMAGRTYRYATEEPLFPFGFGLSYAKFSYDSIQSSSANIAKGESLTVTVKVSNTGNREAEEVVQLYLSDIEASVTVPFYSLKGFQRIALKPGGSQTVTFDVTPEMMQLIGNDGQAVIEPGEFKVIVGGSSPGARSEDLGAPTPVEAVFTVV